MKINSKPHKIGINLLRKSEADASQYTVRLSPHWYTVRVTVKVNYISQWIISRYHFIPYYVSMRLMPHWYTVWVTAKVNYAWH